MNRIGLCLSLLLLASCAHHRDVRPGDEGIHRVVVTTDDTEEGARNAINQANHFCEKRQKSAAFVNEEKKYSGDMDEKTYNNAKRASKVAQSVGGAVWVFGGKQESALGGLAGLGGAAVGEALGNGYTIEMKFKCI